MENGVYTKQPIDFSKWEIRKFIPHLYDSTLYAASGCGYCTLSLLTGINPLVLKKINHDSNHCSDKFMIKILKMNKFKVLPLTKCLVSNTKSNLVEEKIYPYHLMMTSQLYKKNECSWTVSVFNLLYHNFEIYPQKALEYINRPIVSSYLLHHSNYI